MAGRKAGKYSLGKRYAKALFALAQESQKIDKIEGELAAIDNMFAESDDIRKLLLSPIIKKDALVHLASEITKKSGADKIIGDFLRLLAENRRMVLLPLIAKSYSDLASEAKGEITAEVTTASALSKNQVSEISASLKKLTGKNIKVNEKIDGGIIGGMVVKIGSKMLDDSIRGKLGRLALHLKNSNI